METQKKIALKWPKLGARDWRVRALRRSHHDHAKTEFVREKAKVLKPLTIA